MKTSVICALGALVLGSLAAGCSAETGMPQGSGEGSNVGESRSPLVLSSLSTALKNPATCVITDSGVSKLFLYGGENASGVASEALLYNPATDSWAGKGETLSGGGTMPALTQAVMIAVPGDDKCILLGGSSNGTDTVATVYEYDLSADQWTQLQSMPRNRKYGSYSVCGTATAGNTRIVAIGGENAGGYLTAVDLYNRNGNTWGGAAVEDLKEARSHAAFAVNADGNLNKFIVAGGTYSMGERSTGEVLSFTDTTCGTANDTKKLIDAFAADINIGARTEAVAFPEGTADTFLVTLGYSGGAINTTKKLAITNWATGATTMTAGTTLTTGRRNPVLVKFSPTKFAIAGGLATNSEDAVDIWDTSLKSFLTEFDMSQVRTNFAAEYLPTLERAVVVGGLDTTPNPDVLLTAVEAL